MSLKWYRRPRLVVLNVTAPVRDAARALNVESVRADEILPAVGATIARTVSAGQIRDVRSQVPEDLGRIFEEGPLADAA